MTKHNPENERIKRKYFAYLKEAKRHSEPTVDAAAKALSRFEEYNRYRNFKAFHFEQAIAFKRHLAEQTGQRSGEKLSKATLHATLKQLRAVLFLACRAAGVQGAPSVFRCGLLQPVGERRAHCHGPARAESADAGASEACDSDDAETGTRSSAGTALWWLLRCLTGARDSAIASMKLKHVDLKEGCVYQDAREVKTKFSKTFTTYFFPVGDEVRQIVAEWVRFLREEKLWGNDDPLFPATRIVVGQTHQFEAAGLETGALEHCRRRFGRSSVRHSSGRACRTSIRTACGRRWRGLGKKSASPPKSSRHGVRTWGMNRF